MADPALLLNDTALTQLAEMNLDLKGLRDVVRYADAERALTSSNDTPGLDQALVYHKIGRALRDTFCGKHWEVDNSDNHTAIKHRTKPLRIVPCNFDENTGNVLIQPSNRTSKGAVMEQRTICNRTGSLFEPDELPVRRREGRITWVLGAYSFPEVPPRAELSLPVAFSDKHITSLEKRIIVLDGTENPEGARAGEDAVDIVDIQVRSRG